MFLTLKLNTNHHRAIVMYGQMTHTHLIVFRDNLLKQRPIMTTQISQRWTHGIEIQLFTRGLFGFDTAISDDQHLTIWMHNQLMWPNTVRVKFGYFIIVIMSIVDTNFTRQAYRIILSDV